MGTAQEHWLSLKSGFPMKARFLEHRPGIDRQLSPFDSTFGATL
jgi:hypothetical protein